MQLTKIVTKMKESLLSGGKAKGAQIVLGILLGTVITTLTISLATRANATPPAPMSRKEFEDLEVQIFFASSKKLAPYEKIAAREVQNHPKSKYGLFLECEILQKKFLDEPLEIDILKQSAQLAAQIHDLYPDSDLGITALIQALDIGSEPEKAMVLINKTEMKSSNFSWRYFVAKAKIQSQLSNFSDSERSFNKALQHASIAQYDLIAAQMLDDYSARSDENEVAKKIESLAHQYPSSYFMGFMIKHLLKTGRSDYAKKYADRLIQYGTMTSHAVSNYSLALLSLKSEQSHSKAIQQLRTALQQDPPHILAQEIKFLLALLLTEQLKLGSTNKIQVYQELSLLVAQSVEKEKLIVALTEMLVRGKDTLAAVELLDSIQHATPGIDLVFGLKGEVLSTHVNDQRSAIRSYGDAIALNPTRSVYHNGRGLSYYRLKEYHKALDNFLTASEVDPTNASARYNTACIFAISGKSKEALEALAGAISLEDSLALQAQNDQDFLSLRKLPEFISITSPNQDSKDLSSSLAH
jgi:tetratricopeptide (TPR) repeat protein